MRKYTGIIFATFVLLACAFGQGKAEAQVLTINSGSTLTINGGILDVNCLDILIKNGGTLDLQAGTILDRNVITMEPTGNFSSSGTIVNCWENSFYVIPHSNGKAVIITLPKK